MKLSDLDFELPEELIARIPTQNRTDSRLMVINAETADISHSIFSQIDSFLNSKDLLVINTTKVLPAFTYCYKLSGGKIQILYLFHEGAVANCLVSGAKIDKGQVILSLDKKYSLEIKEKNEDGS